MKNYPRVLSFGVVLLFAFGALLRAEEPAAAKAHGYTVTTEVEVDEQGKPTSVVLIDADDLSTGDFLTKLAVAMAARSEFPPREKEGHAVKYKVRVPFFFPVEDDEGAVANEQPRPRAEKDGVIQPAYPLEEAKAGEVGGVILEMIVGADGRVTSLKTLRASKASFAESAMQAVRQWKFIPAMAGDRPVETRWRLAVVFESSRKMVEDYKYRVPPRPSFGTFVVGHNEDVPAAPEGGAQAPNKSEEIPPSVTTPAK